MRGGVGSNSRRTATGGRNLIPASTPLKIEYIYLNVVVSEIRAQLVGHQTLAILEPLRQSRRTRRRWRGCIPAKNAILVW